MPLGGFRLFTTLNTAVNHDDNVYRAETGTRGDFYFLENPGFNLQSQWSRHELDFYGALNAYQYASLPSEDNVNGNIGGNGRLDILRGLDFAAGGSYAIEHEPRTSPDQPGFAKSPTQYALTQANAALTYHRYQFGLQLGGTLARYVYDPTVLIGSPSLNNSDRNRDEYVSYAKASYEFSPGYAAFLQSNYKIMQYDTLIDRNALRRDNSGFNVNAGVDMLVTDLIKGQVFAGYLDQHYKAPLTDVSGFNFGADVVWSATPLWSFHLTASRTLNGTTLNGASTQDDQLVRLEADYQVEPNIQLQGHVGYTDSNFNGTTRDDQYTIAGATLTYLMNHYMSANVGYEYQKRASTIAGQSFNDNLATVGLNFRL